MMRLPFTTAVALTLGALLLLPSAAANRGDAGATRLHVLVVAHNESLDPDVRALRFADDDGARYFELFSEMTPRVSLLTVLDPETARIHPAAARAAKVPWMRSLREAVDRIARDVRRDNRAGRRTAFTFIYVGHGNVAPDGEGYVNLQDMRLRRRDLFREVVDRVPAGTVHLIIDACKSFFLVSRGPADWRDDRSGHTYGEEVKAFLSRSTLQTHPQVGAILSTSGDEDVHEWSAFKSGVFSHQLRSALAGAADINGDGVVEYSEVGAFIAAANRRVVHQRARLRPFVQPPPSDLHAPLFSVRTNPLRLELEAGLRGRLSVEDERGVRILDLNKAPGMVLRLALAPAHEYFVRHAGEEAVVPRHSHGLLYLGRLDRGPASASPPRGSVDQAYRDDMFAVSLSRSFYDGYLAMSDMPAVSFTGGPVEDRTPTSGRWQLELSYLMSPVALELYGGVQHTVTVGLRRTLVGPLFVAARAELGVSRHDLPAEEGQLSLLRTAVLLGAGLRWDLWRDRLELALELDAGYQALFTTVKDEFDPASAKFGSQLMLTCRPWRRAPTLGLAAHVGLYGQVFTVTEDSRSREQVFAQPEGGLGLVWGF